jgi:hypothetical protein
MSCIDGVPITPGLQVNWVDISGQEALGVSPFSAQRGKPVSLEAWQMRTIRGPGTVPQPGPIYLHSRPYSRGAQAYAPKFGVINYNPIGAGIYGPYRLPTIAGPGARYEAAAIWFNVQAVPTTMRMNPTVPVETVDALIATSHATLGYYTTG